MSGIKEYGPVNNKNEVIAYQKHIHKGNKPFIGITKDGKAWMYTEETSLTNIKTSELAELLDIDQNEAIKILTSKGEYTYSLAEERKVKTEAVPFTNRPVKKKVEVSKSIEYATKDDLIEFKKDILNIMNEFLRNLKGKK